MRLVVFYERFAAVFPIQSFHTLTFLSDNITSIWQALFITLIFLMSYQIFPWNMPETGLL